MGAPTRALPRTVDHSICGSVPGMLCAHAAPPALEKSVQGVGGAARGGLANLIGVGFTGLTGLAVTWLVARGLGTDHAGAFFAATAMFALATGLARLGTQTSLVYWPARLRARGNANLLGECLRTGLTPVGAVALVMAALLWTFAPALAGLTAPDSAPAVVADHTGQLRMLAVFLPLAAIADAVLTATRGYRMLRPTIMLERIVRPGLQLAGIGGLALAAAWVVLPPHWYALAWAGPYLPVALLGAYALRRVYLSGPVPAEAPTSRARRLLRRRFWRFTGPRAVASVAQLALQRLDVLLVAAFGGLAAAALYAVAGRFVVLGQFANQGIGQAVQPRLAEALATGDRDRANALYQAATGWLVLAAWPLYLVVITFAPVYLGAFGSGYRDGGAIVVVLGSAMLFSTGCGMVDSVLTMAGRTTWNLWNVLLALVVTITLDLLLIPSMGALGAAIGLAVAVLINNLVPLLQVGLVLGLHPFGRGTMAAGALAIAAFGGVAALAMHALGPTVPGLLAALAGGGALYALGIHRLRNLLALDDFLRLRRHPN
ncbi:O-antigen/teichoic acid export membrane protein [Catenuloplanes nepalensis]|uniref:O-antigen/teichoic acid export membrane protein n=1 Tax=Catenuloplanes nepalensis TaxID=587533 RepID=A0ABT9N6F9_9ACTN|nr:polysaccharide biosynthesis C-terminal domain-containing protein [Catenuloplanes nepalensis]MDP9799282.1 O-antigen/teichoic acid export membrane protein [Catenuloplanes nepalensis]